MKYDEKLLAVDMPEGEIFEALGMTGASKVDQQSLLDDIDAITEARLVGLLGTLVSDDDNDHLQVMEENGATHDEIMDWVSTNITHVDVIKMKRALVRDYVEELKMAYEEAFGDDFMSESF